MSIWKPTPEWRGEKCFIIGGGPSALQHDLTRLKGKRVICINSSYIAATPWADADNTILIFSDTRWHDDHYRKWKEFKGRIVSASLIARSPRLLRMKRDKIPGLKSDGISLYIDKTTLTSAINLAVYLGVVKIVLIGVDGKADAQGRHHHHAPHRWKPSNGCYAKQRKDIVRTAADLRKLGIECVNASPGSALADLWPIVDFTSELDQPAEIEPRELAVA